MLLPDSMSPAEEFNTMWRSRTIFLAFFLPLIICQPLLAQPRCTATTG